MGNTNDTLGICKLFCVATYMNWWIEKVYFMYFLFEIYAFLILICPRHKSRFHWGFLQSHFSGFNKKDLRDHWFRKSTQRNINFLIRICGSADNINGFINPLLYFKPWQSSFPCFPRKASRWTLQAADRTPRPPSPCWWSQIIIDYKWSSLQWW